MKFGEALEALDAGKSVLRAGWNGKNQFVTKIDSLELPVLTPNKQSGPFLAFYTSRGTWQAGWLASQADMLADDWEVL